MQIIGKFHDNGVTYTNRVSGRSVSIVREPGLWFVLRGDCATDHNTRRDALIVAHEYLQRSN